MKRRVFRRVFIIYGIVLLFSIIFINFYLSRIIRTTYIDALKESLSVQTSIIADIVPTGSQTVIEKF